MKISMELLSDSIFGNGRSVAGGEDISIVHDAEGFPYFKGNTFKGIFREELNHLLKWKGIAGKDICNIVKKMLGEGGDDSLDTEKLVFSDLVIPEAVKEAVLDELKYDPSADTKAAGQAEKKDTSDQVLRVFTNMRTFTALELDGRVKPGSLRMARCVNKGISLEGELTCPDSDKELVTEVLGMIRWAGTMRNRGFGQVRVRVEEV